MKDLESIKRTIHSAEDLSSVVRTMKTMAAVGIRQYETAAESLLNYTRTVESGLAMLLSGAADTTPSNGSVETTVHSTTAATHRKRGVFGAIIFGSDQGMCGQFNEQISQFVLDAGVGGGKNHNRPPVLCVGQRVADKLAGQGIEVERVFHLPSSANAITGLAHDLVTAIDTWRNTHGINTIQLYYNRRETGSSSRPFTTQLLPLRLDRIRHRATVNRISTDRSLPYWTMNKDQLFSRFVRQWLFAKLFRATAESLSAENASRIAAMQSAERNIADRLAELKSTFAHQRQTAITEELLDVVTGFEALQRP